MRVFGNLFWYRRVNGGGGAGDDLPVFKQIKFFNPWVSKFYNLVFLLTAARIGVLVYGGYAIYWVWMR